MARRIVREMSVGSTTSGPQFKPRDARFWRGWFACSQSPRPNRTAESVMESGLVRQPAQRRRC
jgi:hypothetical protein